jgi:sugar-phosphatase
VVAADDVTRGEPHPEGYVRALAALGDLEPAAAVAFEDTEAGIAAALAAGARCVGVRGTLPDERLAAAEAIVDTIDVELVRSLVG